MMQRYTPQGSPVSDDHPNARWVRHEDADAEIRGLVKRVTELEAERDALIAERDRLVTTAQSRASVIERRSRKEPTK